MSPLLLSIVVALAFLAHLSAAAFQFQVPHFNLRSTGRLSADEVKVQVNSILDFYHTAQRDAVESVEVALASAHPVHSHQKAAVPAAHTSSSSSISTSSTTSSNKMSLAAVPYPQSGWLEMRIRSKVESCKGQVAMIMGTRLGCYSSTRPNTDGTTSPFSVNVNAMVNDNNMVQLSVNTYDQDFCGTEAAPNSINFAMSKCNTQYGNGMHVNTNMDEDFSRFNGMVKLGYASLNDCMFNQNYVFSYQIYREKQCMTHTGSTSASSHRLNNCIIGMNGPECMMEGFDNAQCRSKAPYSGVQYSNPMSWRNMFYNTSLPNAYTCGTEYRSIGMAPGANYYKIVLVKNGAIVPWSPPL